ncbi:MAG: hypothetical protein L0Z50_40165 [Verrucomicrobiales bacterium]|nr:hypothetical protein [Verrucomicrobiales bacterium]
MTFALNILLGAAGGTVTALLLTMRQPKDRVIPLAILLSVAAGIYVGFGLRDEQPGQAVLQVLGALPFLAVAAVWPRSLRILGAAWLTHRAWDALHGFGIAHATVPSWYPGVCFGWDMVLGVTALCWAYASHNDAVGHPEE